MYICKLKHIPVVSKSNSKRKLKIKRRVPASTQVASLVRAPSRPRVSRPTTSNVDASIRAYYAVMHDPFDRLAKGARQLDPFSYPTTTASAEGIMTIQTDAQGNAALAILCDATLTAIADVGTILSSSMQTFPANTYALGATSQSQLSNLFATYRCVGGGVQVRNLQQPVSTKGRLYASKVASSGTVLPVQALGYALNQDAVLKLSTSVGDIDGRILNLPESTETTMQDLIQNVLPVNFRPCSALSTVFKNANPQTYLGGAGADATYLGCVIGKPSSSTLLQFATPSDIAYGFDVIFLRFSGCQPNEVVAEVKYTLHYEGTPALLQQTGAVIPDSSAVGPHLPRTAAAIEQAAARKSTRTSWIEDAAEIGKTVVKGVEKALSIAKVVGEHVPMVEHLIDAISLLV